MTGKRPLWGRTPYAASKLALVGLVRTLALEVAPSGERVNLVSPGPVAGERMDWAFRAQAEGRGISVDEARQEMIAEIPIGRLVGGRRGCRCGRRARCREAHSRDRCRPERQRRHGDVLKGASMPRIIDLSQDIYTGMIVYPGHLKTVLFDHASHAETAPRFDSGFSFQTKGFLMNDNGPTHVDSFSHLDPDPSAQTIDEMPLELFYGDAICVDVTGADPRTDIPVERVERGLADGELQVRRGDIVLFYTGTATMYGGRPEYVSEFPGLGADVADWIVERGVKSFGVDTCTPDNPSSRVYPIHMMGRKHHITHYENLTNLDQVVGRRFTFIGLPLKLKGAHGGPTRAAAVLDE